MSLTVRDAEIIDALVHRVRVLSIEQIGRAWWSEAAAPAQQAAPRMKVLVSEGLLMRYQALAHPELPLKEPIVCWSPGEAEPDFSAVSYQLQSRWTKPFTSIQCFIATKRAGRVFGGYGGRRSRQSEQTHDLHLSAVFLRYRTTSPHLVSKWTSEAAILGSRDDRREKLPDAMIQDSGTQRVVEFGGAYPKEKIAAFHGYCAGEAYPYEVW